jgi:hypothetical protein
MAHQLAVIHQDKGKSKAVASPSSVQVLSKHPSTRMRKFIKLIGKDDGMVRCPILTTTRYSMQNNMQPRHRRYADLGDPGRDDPHGGTGGKFARDLALL